MLLNALTNYLSNQPVADASAGLSATAAPAQATDTLPAQRAQMNVPDSNART